MKIENPYDTDVEIKKWVDELVKWCYHSPTKKRLQGSETDYPFNFHGAKFVEFEISTGPGQIVCYNFDDDSFDIFPDDCRHTITREQLIAYLKGLQERGEFHITEIEAWLMKQTL